MRVLLINDYGTPRGGAEVYVIRLAQELKRRGHSIGLLASTPPAPGLFDYTLVAHGFNREPSLSILVSEAFNPLAHAAARQAISEFQPDLVHAHNIVYELTPSVLLAAESTPVVATMHDVGATCPIITRIDAAGETCLRPFGRACLTVGCINSANLGRQFLRFRIHKHCFDSIDELIVPSEYGARIARISGWREPTIIHPGVVTEVPEGPAGPGDGSVLFAGRLVRGKGLADAIHAFARIDPKLKARFIIAGTGPEELRCRDLAESLQVADRVSFLGWKSQGELAQIQRRASVVVVPSLVPEMTGLVALEAMALGKPVVVTDAGALREAVLNGETGYVLPTGDIDGLAESLERILRSPGLASRLGINGWNRVRRDFNLKTHAEDVQRVYTEALSRAAQELGA